MVVTRRSVMALFSPYGRLCSASRRCSVPRIETTPKWRGLIRNRRRVPPSPRPSLPEQRGCDGACPGSNWRSRDRGALPQAAAVDAARIALENLRLVLGRQRQLIDVALGVVVVVAGLRIDAANRADHFRGKKNVIDRDDLRQQLLAGQVIDAGVEEYVLQHEVGQQPELGVLRQAAVAPPMIGYGTATMRNDELDGREILENRRG